MSIYYNNLRDNSLADALKNHPFASGMGVMALSAASLYLLAERITAPTKPLPAVQAASAVAPLPAPQPTPALAPAVTPPPAPAPVVSAFKQPGFVVDTKRPVLITTLGNPVVPPTAAEPTAPEKPLKLETFTNPNHCLTRTTLTHPACLYAVNAQGQATYTLMPSQGLTHANPLSASMLVNLTPGTQNPTPAYGSPWLCELHTNLQTYQCQSTTERMRISNLKDDTSLATLQLFQPVELAREQPQPAPIYNTRPTTNYNDPSYGSSSGSYSPRRERRIYVETPPYKPHHHGHAHPPRNNQPATPDRPSRPDVRVTNKTPGTVTVTPRAPRVNSDRPTGISNPHGNPTHPTHMEAPRNSGYNGTAQSPSAPPSYNFSGRHHEGMNHGGGYRHQPSAAPVRSYSAPAPVRAAPPTTVPRSAPPPPAPRSGGDRRR